MLRLLSLMPGTVCLMLLLCLRMRLAIAVHSELRTHPGNCSSTCDPTKCPAPPVCKQTIARDACNCCLVCPQAKRHPIANDGACSKVTCTGRKICIINMQGLPLCKCPSSELCRGADRQPVCGSDRILYFSPCHKRLQECRKGKKISEVRRRDCHFRQNIKGAIVSMKNTERSQLLPKRGGHHRDRPEERARTGETRGHRRNEKTRGGQKRKKKSRIQRLRVKIKRMEKRVESSRRLRQNSAYTRGKGAASNTRFSRKKLDQLRSKLAYAQHKARSRFRRRVTRHMHFGFFRA